MKKFPIALQLYSVRGDMEADFTGTLKKVKALGYDGVEFAGLFGRSAQEVRAQLDEIGLRGISAHVPYAEMMTDPEKVLGDYAAIGCAYIAIPYAEEAYRPGGEKFEEMVENAKMLGRIAKEKGMVLLYHNHDFEFQKIDGECGLDILYKRVPADLLQTELDTCWVNVGGEEPAAYIEKYAGRAPVVHLKDFVMPGKKPAKLYALIGIDDEQQAEEGGAFEMRPVGYGAQDFPAILAAAEKAGTEWVVVEQDEPTKGLTPMECAEKSIGYLKSIGL